MLLDHLAIAERLVVHGEDHIESQQGLIAELSSGSHDTIEARNLLKLFEHTQLTFVSDRDRLRKERGDDSAPF